MADPVDQSILETTKALLGRMPDEDPFDAELIVFINSSISNLTQLGVGPRDGLVIDKDTKWSALLGESTKFENAKSYIFMTVKLVYDSGTMSQPLIAAFEKMIAEQAWRLQIAADKMQPPLPFVNVLNDDGDLVTVPVQVVAVEEVWSWPTQP